MEIPDYLQHMLAYFCIYKDLNLQLWICVSLYPSIYLYLSI